MADASIDTEFGIELRAAGDTIAAAQTYEEKLRACEQEAERLARGFENVPSDNIVAALRGVVEASGAWSLRQRHEIEHVIRSSVRGQSAFVNGHSQVPRARRRNDARDSGGNEPTSKRRRFTLVPFKDIESDRAPAWLVKGIIPREGLSVIWGPPKCGKSFWTFDLVMHIARGLAYRDRRVQQGPVVYLALEGGAGFKDRIEAYKRHHNVEDAPFYLITDRTDLIADHSALIAEIKDQLPPLPALVVIDTLNRSLGGSENKDEDMAKYIRAADVVRETFKCAVVIVHHCGVSGNRPRGHTSLTGAADAQLAVTRDNAGNIVVEIEWMKDGPTGATIVSALPVVELGADEYGDTKTSCVVVPVDGPAQSEHTSRLSDRQRTALGILADYAAEHGIALPASLDLPAGLRAVKLEDWRNELYSRGCLDRDAKNPREDYRRLRLGLVARKLVGIRDDLIWDARCPG